MTTSARLLAACAVVSAAASSAPAQTPAHAAPPADSLYANSLHYTNRGIEFVYSKERGGLERITGLSASEMGCVKAKCHATSCDTCHRAEAGGKASYTLDPAVLQAACERCHGAPEIEAGPRPHRGMRCMRCHTAREIHGDGVAHDSYMQAGVLEARCERCHADRSKSSSHTIHRATLACGACHTGTTDTCLNCHVRARLAGQKDAEIRLRGMLFLVNHDGRVTTANVLSHVYGKRTMITVAPTFAHSVTRQGRACAECHGSAIVREVAAGAFRPVTWIDGKAANLSGVIPVVDPLAWSLPFLDRKDGAWVPLAGAERPVVQFSGNCSPLTREQLARLAEPKGPR